MTKHTPDIEHLRALVAVVQLGLRAAISDQLAGHPRAAAYNGDRTTGGGGSDPTANAATSPDPAAHDLAAHDHALDSAYRALLTLAGLSEKYLPGHMARRGQLEADTRTCHLHDRAGVTHAHKAKHRSDLGSFLTQPLREPVDICQACYDFCRNHGRVPTGDELIRHDRSGRWSARTNPKATARTVVVSQQVQVTESRTATVGGDEAMWTPEAIAGEWAQRPGAA